VESAPCLKLVHKTFGSLNAATDLMFLRLSMPVEFHHTFKVRAGTTPLTRTLTVPEDEVPETDPDSDYELLKKSVARREQEEDKKEPSVPKETPALKNGENEKDASTEKSRKKGSVWFGFMLLEIHFGFKFVWIQFGFSLDSVWIHVGLHSVWIHGSLDSCCIHE